MTTYIGNPPKSVYGVKDATNVLLDYEADGTDAYVDILLPAHMQSKFDLNIAVVSDQTSSPLDGLAIYHGSTQTPTDYETHYLNNLAGSTQSGGVGAVSYLVRASTGAQQFGWSKISYRDQAFRWWSEGQTYQTTGVAIHTYMGKNSGTLTDSNFVRIASLGTLIEAGVHILVTMEEATNLVLPLEYSAPRKNILINSDFAVNQRAYAGGGLAGNSFGYDRWASGIANSTLSTSGHVATIDNTTASTNGQFYQGIEAGQMIEGRQYTVSWKGDAECSVYYANGGTNVFKSAPFTFISGGGTATIDEYITFRGDGATVSEIKLEEGTSATPWEMPGKATELVRCQRYYEVGSTWETIFSSDVTNGGSYHLGVPFKTNKRTTTPTITLSGGGQSSLAAPTVQGQDSSGFRLVATASATGAGWYTRDWVAQAEI